MSDTRAGDAKTIGQETIQPLLALARFDFDLGRFHVSVSPFQLPEGADTSAPARARTDSRDGSTRGTLRPSRSPDPNGVESAQTQPQAKTPK